VSKLKLVWRDERSLKTARPEPDIIITVTRWSRLWYWSIQRGEHYVVRGTADTAAEGKRRVEELWETLRASLKQSDVVPAATYGRQRPFNR